MIPSEIMLKSTTMAFVVFVIDCFVEEAMIRLEVMFKSNKGG